MYEGIAFPEINPVLFQWGWFAVRWYSLAYIFGILGAWGLARKMSKYSGSTFTVLKIDDFLIWATIGIVLGGRLGYCLFYNLRYFLEFPAQILMIWQGGMSFHGGLLGVLVATILFAHNRQISLLTMGDILTPVAPVGLFLGRLANFANGELYGRVTHSVPWAMIFPNGGPEPRHPSQLYEAGVEGLLCFIVLNALWWGAPRIRNRRGVITGCFFLIYGIGRFFLEYTREPDVHLGFVFREFSMGQLLCLPMILLGLFFIVFSKKNVIYHKEV